MSKKYQVIVLGAGGTGTYFLKEFTRYLAHSKRGYSIIEHLLIIDGDLVEAKNLSRQSYILDDVGENKAIIMADVLNSSFLEEHSLKWLAYDKYITSTTQLLNLISKGNIPILISCVDNHACRLLCEDIYNVLSSCIYFDAANEFSSGEVVFSYKLDDVVYSPCRSFFFPDILDSTKSVVEMSCTELNNVEPQHIVTNMFAGVLLFSGMKEIIENNNYLKGYTTFSTVTLSSEFIDYLDFAKNSFYSSYFQIDAISFNEKYQELSVSFIEEKNILYSIMENTKTKERVLSVYLNTRWSSNVHVLDEKDTISKISYVSSEQIDITLQSNTDIIVSFTH